MSDKKNPRYAEVIYDPPRQTLGSGEAERSPDPEREFRNEDWSLGNILSWIAYRDSALLCEYGQGGSRFFHYRVPRSRGGAHRPRFVDNPGEALLGALRVGHATAIRGGVEILSSHWFGEDTHHLPRDLRFRRSQMLACWPPKGEAVVTVGAAEPPARDTGRETKFVMVQRHIAQNYPAGIVPAEVTDKAIARDTGTSERTVRRARSAKGGVGRK